MVVSIIYCMRFGYILTSYAHGGQLLGIPFAGLMIALVMAFLISDKNSVKQGIFNIALAVFISLAGFSLTIELIRSMKEDYFGFLYYNKIGQVDEILLIWFLIGALLCIGNEFFMRRS